MWRRKKRSFADFQEEIESHLAIEADEVRNTARNANSEAAARRAFGNLRRLRKKWHEHSHSMFIDYLGRDSAQGLRQSGGSRAFSHHIVTLALGIGANSAIFKHLLRRFCCGALPYKDPSRLAMVFSGDPARELHEGRVSLLNYADWEA